MKIGHPRVSICLPVYNGEEYIREAIRSVLDQTFEDFELIISDNASEDRTAEICNEFSTKDPRVFYSRSDINRGLAWNHNRTFAQAKGQFLMWIGHDDLLGRAYISRCIEAMDEDPGVVLSYSNANHIDDNGNSISQVDMNTPATSNKPSQRFQSILYTYIDVMIYGLMKREILSQTALHGGFAESDRVLLAEMGLRGRFHLVPEYLYSRRFHHMKTSLTDSRERTLVFDPSRAGKVFFPELDKSVALFSAVNRAELPLSERLSCYKHLLGWFQLRRNTFWKDLQIGLKIKATELENQHRKVTSIAKRFQKNSGA